MLLFAKNNKRREMSSVAGESLFAMVKEYILKHPTRENIDVLSPISKVGDEYDYHSIENAMDAIQNRFNGQESVHHRREVYTVFGERILVENAEQLVANYNRILANVRKTFPAFNLVHEGHNGVFGNAATVSCVIRRCSDEDITSYTVNQFFHPRGVSDDYIAETIEELKESYEEDHDDTLAGKARIISSSNTVSKNLSAVMNYTGYSGNEYRGLNALLRCDKGTSILMHNMIKSFGRFGINLALPMYTSDDLVIYRGDGLSTSPQKLTTRGFYSGSLSPDEMGKFVTNGGRIIKINVPAGTHFLPIILKRVDEGELVLLPGTVLEKQSEMTWDKGQYAEYTVVSNPPKISDVEEATLLMNAIHSRYPDMVSTYRVIGPGTKMERRKFIGSMPEPTGPSMDEMKQFTLDLVNSRYHCDW